MKGEMDQIVKEIPVYISKKLAEQLYMIQYPLRPQNNGYDENNIIKTLVKPENQELVMHLGIEVNKKCYNKNKGQAIVTNAEASKQKEEESVFESEYMDKIVLTSSRSIPKCDNYAIGIFQDGELHLCPVKSIIQMRPQFNYLEKNDKKSREEGKLNSEDIEEEEEAKQVNVTFARQVPDFIKKMREQSFQNQSKKSLEEEWIPIDYNPVSSSKSELTKLEMICSAGYDSMNNLKLSKNDYLKLLTPVEKEEDLSKKDTSNFTRSLTYIQSLPLLDQIRSLMKDAKVLSFVQLRSIICKEHETHAILKYLQQVAVLVQGNWVVNSELVYPKDTMSEYSGIPAELMCRARDYILLAFTDHEFVDRRTVSSVIKLPSEEIREIFTNIAKHQPKKGWRLIVIPNKDFIERYPEIAQRQQMLWEAKRKNLHESMVQPAPQRHRRKSNRESFSSENEESKDRSAPRGKKSHTRHSDTPMDIAD